MNAYEILKRPMVTEKGTHQSQLSHAATRHEPARGGSFAFEVHPDATKPMIRHAVEMIYKVRVLAVRTSNRHGKRRRVRGKMGNTRNWKKAVVVLHADSHIDLF